MSRTRRDQAAQISNRADALPGVFGNLDCELLLQGALQLDQAQAVKTDVFAEPARIGEVVDARAPDCFERVDQRIIACGDLAAGTECERRASSYVAALHLAGRGAGEISIGP